MKRRNFLGVLGSGSFVGAAGSLGTEILGQGAHRYRVVPGWGILGMDTPVKNCHGIVEDAEGHILLLTDHVQNNVIVYDSAGRLVHKWGTDFPGAHGLSLVKEGVKEVLYITDLQKHCIVKTSLSGEVLQRWEWPESSGKYKSASEYKPSWTLHDSGGDFFVLDGYGKDYILHYGAGGELMGSFGGAEGGVTHWGPHGGMMERRAGAAEGLLIAMSDQQYLMRMSLKGDILDKTSLPGGNPRQIRQRGAFYYVAHLADNWPANRASRGFLSVLDKDLRVVANLAGSAPIYDDAGKLMTMRHEGETFLHPHDLCPSRDGCIYVAQFNSGGTYPIKLEPV